MRRTASLSLALGALTTLAACSNEPPTAVELRSTQVKNLNAGFLTAQPAQAEALLPQARVTPIITSGDIIPGTTVAWAPTPDGLGAYLANGSLFVFANHELNASGVTSTNGGPAIKYARVSKLQLDPLTLRVLGGSYVEDGSSKLERLCSATFADGFVGFPTGYFFTGEETIGTANGSVVMAIDTQGNKTFLPHLGALAHENQIAVPGFNGKVVGIGLDDNAGASELYMYVAANEADFISGNGKLYVFRTDETTATGTRLHSGNMRDGQVVSGSFAEITDPADLGAAPATRAARLQSKADAVGAMPFVRIEDGDYDKNSLSTPAIYFVDTGSPSVTGRAAVNANCFGVCDLAGSLYRMEFDANNPTQNVKLILVERSKGAAAGWASPDNIATSHNSIMLQEDPAYSGFDGSRAPAIWNIKLAEDGRKAHVTRKVAQATQESLIPGANGKCVDAQGLCWETSGIINAERWLGEGSWLFVVQAHTLPFSVKAGETTFNYRNESGQLLYLRLPGS